jgi:hypothetical protein
MHTLLVSFLEVESSIIGGSVCIVVVDVQVGYVRRGVLSVLRVGTTWRSVDQFHYISKCGYM